jgi:hypothetical protein
MKNNFLKWWLLNAAVFCCLVISAYFGVVRSVYEKDSSFLTFVIAIMYFAISGYNGYIAWCLDKGGKLEEKDTDTGWFVSELCLSLGMIGTVVGFIQMLAGFSDSPDGVAALKELLGKMSFGMSTALYTTLGGLIFGNLLKLQCFMLEKNLKEEIECRKSETTDHKQVS